MSICTRMNIVPIVFCKTASLPYFHNLFRTIMYHLVCEHPRFLTSVPFMINFDTFFNILLAKITNICDRIKRVLYYQFQNITKILKRAKNIRPTVLNTDVFI